MDDGRSVTETTPERIGAYRVLRRLGAGGMGEVFLAFDPRLERQVAIKRVRASEGLGDEGRGRFRREARAAAALSHPAVVQVYELLEAPTGDPSGDPLGDHLVMEYVEGRTVAELLTGGPLPDATAAGIAAQVASGLAAAHARGLLHRDLKAENVVVTSAGQAKILDFGLAKHLWRAGEGDKESALTQAGALVGTTRVMSPEQARGGAVDLRSDLFSLGVLLYEMLTGRSPFRGENALETLHNVLTREPPPLEEAAPGVPAELAALTGRLLEKDPARRPQSALEVIPVLNAAAGSGPGSGGGEGWSAGSGTGGGTGDPAGGGFTGSLSELPTGGLPAPAFAGIAPRPSVPPPTRAAEPRRRRWIAPVATLVAGALAASTAVYLASRPPTSPRRVAVLPPEVETPTGAPGGAVSPAEPPPEAAPETQPAAGAGDLVPSGVLVTTLGTLASLEGIEAVDPSQLDGTRGSPAERARAAAADEALVLTLAGDGATRRVTLRRIRQEGGVVLGTETFQVPAAPEDALVLAGGVAAALRRLFSGHPVRPGTPDLEIAAGDYRAFLEVKARVDSGQVPWVPELARLEAIATASPRFLDVHLLAADVARDLFTDSGDPAYLERALPLARRGAELAPTDPRPLASLFRIALGAGRRSEAQAALERLEEISPGSSHAPLCRSQLAEAEGDLEEAVAEMAEAVARSPSWRHLHRLALLEVKGGRVDAARRHLEELLRRAPGNTWGLAKLAELELLYGDLARSETLYLDLLAGEPHRSYYTNLGLGRLLRGRYQSAGEAFRHALELDPDHPGVLLNLADATVATGAEREARELYRRVLELLAHRGQTVALTAVEKMNQAQCLARLGETDRAVSLALDTLSRHSEDAEVTYQAALVFALAGEKASALAGARKALEMGIQPRWLTVPGFEAVRADPELAARLSDG